MDYGEKAILTSGASMSIFSDVLLSSSFELTYMYVVRRIIEMQLPNKQCSCVLDKWCLSFSLCRLFGAHKADGLLVNDVF